MKCTSSLCLQGCDWIYHGIENSSHNKKQCIQDKMLNNHPHDRCFPFNYDIKCIHIEATYSITMCIVFNLILSLICFNLGILNLPYKTPHVSHTGSHLCMFISVERFCITVFSLHLTSVLCEAIQFSFIPSFHLYKNLFGKQT